MGLDWSAPAYSDQDPADPSVPPLRHIEIRDFSLSVARGAALAHEGSWEEARLAYEQAFSYGESDQPYLWFERAALELAVGDRARYRLTCKQMLDVFLGKNQLPWLEFAAHALVLCPGVPPRKPRPWNSPSVAPPSIPTAFRNTSLGWPSTALADLPKRKLDS